MPVKKFFTLKLNSFGVVVEECAKLLQKAGSTIKPGKEFTIGMLSAVKAFQKKNGLPVTGEIDAKTYKKLQDVVNKKCTKKPAKTAKAK